MHVRSCYVHHFCGSLLTVDVAVSFQRLQMIVDGNERSVIVAYYVSSGIGSCCIGFLKSKLTKIRSLYEGVLAQVRSIRLGSSVAVIISCLTEETIVKMTINRIDDTESDE